MIDPTFMQPLVALTNLGLGLFMIVLIAWIVLRPPDYVGKFIASQQAQSVALAQMASAVERSTARDDQDLQAVQIIASVLNEKVDILLARGK